MVVLVGEPRNIGGNIAQFTSKGKVKIIDAKGKEKYISAKSFQKQLLKNADKIKNGDSFEFKKNSTMKNIAKGVGIAGAAAGLAAAVIYRKDIGKYAKEWQKTIKETDWNAVGKQFKTYLKDDFKPLMQTNFSNVMGQVKNTAKQVQAYGKFFTNCVHKILNFGHNILKEPSKAFSIFRKTK